MLASGLSEEIDDAEELARFLTSSNQFNQTMVKPSAFLPSHTSRETSVSRHGASPAEQLWSLGAAAAGERNLWGAAIIFARAVRSAQLKVVADEPPARHAVVRGWP